MSAPGRISDGKLVLGEGSDKLWFRKTQIKKKITLYPGWRVNEATPWSQATGWGLSRSIWWLGLYPRGLAGPSRKQRHGFIFEQNHYRQKESLGSGAVCIRWQAKAGSLLFQSAADENGYQNMDRHLSGRKEAKTCRRGREILMRRNIRRNLNLHHLFIHYL